MQLATAKLLFLSLDMVIEKAKRRIFCGVCNVWEENPKPAIVTV